MTDKKIRNPLEELYSDAAGAINSKELAEFLKPFLRINRTNKKVFFTADGLQLQPKKKIILLLLVRKALFLLGDIEEEETAPKILKREFQKSIPQGTIDVNLKRLREEGIIRGDDSKYFIPDINFQRIREMF